MPIRRTHEKLVSCTVYDNDDRPNKGVTVGFNIRHPDTGHHIWGHPDVDMEEIDYLIQCLIIAKAHMIARQKYLDERKSDRQAKP